MENRKLTIVSFGLIFILLASYIPAASADGDSNQPTYAFLPGWNGVVSGTLDPSGEAFSNGHEFKNHDVDENGNIYYIQSEDYGTWMNGQYSFSNDRGFHILKIDNEGNVEYTEKIECSTYCNSPDYTYSKAIGIEVVNEDEFYVILSVYRMYLNIDGTQYNAYSGNYNLVTAFYSNGSWSWVDIEQTSSWAYSTIAYYGVDENSNLFVVQRTSTSGNYEYSITSYSPNGTNWVRTLETYSANFANVNPMFDVEGSDLHIFATVTQLKYDSQTVNCQNPGEAGYCHIWIKINENGVRTSETDASYTSIQFTQMQVHNESLYLSGNTYDPFIGSDTESNFTGQKISHSPRYGQYVAVMENDGSWSYHEVMNQVSSSYRLYGEISDILEDGSFLFNSLYEYGTQIDNTTITNSNNVEFESIVMRIDPSNGLQWYSSIGFNNGSSGIIKMKSDGSTLAFSVYKSNWNTELLYNYSTPVNSSSYYIFWVDIETGQIVDVEPTPANMIGSRSSEGGVIASAYNSIYYYMPDFDGDNVGSSDNCPDTYNPGQLDYNNNGDGDACDSDDDSDGIEDTSDLCPRGVMGWTSNELSDYDSDGCKDIGEEDLDDDNDGKPDITDACPVGLIGAGNDLDGDGCKDYEDSDDDGDLVRDESDLCSEGEIDWSSGTLTDHDGDGCKDEHSEDADDDNDGINDMADSCPRGAVNWPSNMNTDFDGDGCKDGFEDEDDDNDGISNIVDECPKSFGVVNANGCSATQVIDEDQGAANIVYYVCPVGSVVVLDPSDCPEQNENNDSTGDDDNDNNNDNDDNNSGTNSDTFYYVCPGGSEVVTDFSECEGSIATGGTNITLVVDPSSDSSNDYITCEGGKAIVLDVDDCPESAKETVSSVSEESDSGLMLMFMAATFGMSLIAVLVVLFRKPVSADTDFSRIESTDILFTEKKASPNLVDLPTSSPKPSPPKTQSAPTNDMIGTSHEGKEWIEWPAGSNNHYYREIGYGGDWTKFE